MNTMANSPDPGLAPDLHAAPGAALSAVAKTAGTVLPDLRAPKMRRIKDTLVAIYAYGLLGFGVCFPLLMAAWYAFIRPAV